MWADVVEKSKELLVMLDNFGGYLLDWLDKEFPPETSEEQVKHWLVVAAPFVTTLVALFMCICCCRHGSAGRGAKLMIAPGTGRNQRMARPAFERNPRGYFRNLRGKP